MVVHRKPHQIILIEHLFYPFMALLFLALGAGYGSKALVKATELSPEAIGVIVSSISLLTIFIAAAILLPFSFARLWVSTNEHLKGFFKYLSKAYSAIGFVFFISYGILTLIQLPTVISEAIKIATPGS